MHIERWRPSTEELDRESEYVVYVCTVWTDLVLPVSPPPVTSTWLIFTGNQLIYTCTDSGWMKTISYKCAVKARWETMRKTRRHWSNIVYLQDMSEKFSTHPIYLIYLNPFIILYSRKKTKVLLILTKDYYISWII